jgi:anti-sigma regulatory factor (Ser/Thr protein kinase)
MRRTVTVEVRERTTLCASTTSPAYARAFVRETVRRAAAPVPVEDLTLVVSELVTNAVVHGAGEVVLDVTVAEDRVRVEVADAEPVLATPPPVPFDGDSGRGLLLVSRLARRWGVRREAHGKVVWADLAF